MARLEMLGRVAVQPNLSFPGSSSFGPSWGSASSSCCSLKVEHLSVSANVDSKACSGGKGRARFPGRVHPSGSAMWERGVPRAASLLEISLPPGTEATPRLLESTEETVSEASEGWQSRMDCGSRGCRPIFDEEDREDGGATIGSENWSDDEAVNLLHARVASHCKRRAARDLELCPDGSFAFDFAEYVSDVWQEKSIAAKYFDRAVERNPKDASLLLLYAQFAWKALGDLQKADELFARASRAPREDPEVDAMYALFLWQTEEEEEVLQQPQQTMQHRKFCPC